MRSGKKLSKSTTKAIVSAHQALSKVLSEKADPADVAQALLGGPEGDEDENFDPFGNGAAGAMDATGSRQRVRGGAYTIYGPPANPSVQRRVTGDTEVR